MLPQSLLRRIALFTHGPIPRKPFSTNVGPNHELLQMLSRSKPDRCIGCKENCSTFGAGLDHEASSPTRNAYKVRAFARAIEVIGALEHPVQSVDEVKKVRIITTDRELSIHNYGLRISSAQRRRHRNQQQDRRILVR